MTWVLVTGGAGYIGSHVVKLLLQRGYEVLVLDNLVTGYRQFVAPERLIVGDCGDRELLQQIFKTYPIEAVCHLAAAAEVGESAIHPNKYYHNNVVNTLSLLDTMLAAGIKHLVFPSTCAVYGQPQGGRPLSETSLLQPMSPYGASKLMVERILQDYGAAYGLQSMVLRFFNAAGADLKAELGEAHDPETHLIPLTIQAALGQRPHIAIYGDNYATPDGTCLRDYIHVLDLADAFERSLQSLLAHEGGQTLNLGGGRGYSVREVIETVQQVGQCPLKVTITERRPGDPPILISQSARAEKILGWQPQYPQLEIMVQHAWQWHRRQMMNLPTVP